MPITAILLCCEAPGYAHPIAPDQFPSERFEYRGYIVTVHASRNDRDNWRAVIGIQRDGQPVKLAEPERIGPYWKTPAGETL
ncbi:DUF6566 family protein [Paraburkholderia terrae]